MHTPRNALLRADGSVTLVSGVTLADNTTAGVVSNTLRWAVATYRSARLQYSLIRGAGVIGCGTLVLVFAGSSCDVIQDELYPGATDPAVTFTGDVSGGLARLLYTTTSTGTAATASFTVLGVW